jgi:hypothetical protein
VTGLGRFQREVLAAFFQRQRGFFLTGGAALAGYHLRHRTTLDLDLFTTDDLLEEGSAALAAAARALGASMEGLRTSPDFRRFLLRRASESLVVDLVRDSAPQVDPEKTEVAGVPVDSAREIMANKLCTLLARAELRDLVDVRALEAAGLPVEGHLPLARRKDSGLTPGQLAWVLSQLEIGDDASPPGGVSATELRTYLEGLVSRLAALAFPSGPDEPAP